VNSHGCFIGVSVSAPSRQAEGAYLPERRG
jgi:hypothetical protein